MPIELALFTFGKTAYGKGMGDQHSTASHRNADVLIKNVSTVEPRYKEVRYNKTLFIIQWNLVIKRSDITKPSYNKVILLVPALYISLFFYPDITR